MADQVLCGTRSLPVANVRVVVAAVRAPRRRGRAPSNRGAVCARVRRLFWSTARSNFLPRKLISARDGTIRSETPSSSWLQFVELIFPNSGKMLDADEAAKAVREEGACEVFDLLSAAECAEVVAEARDVVKACHWKKSLHEKGAKCRAIACDERICGIVRRALGTEDILVWGTYLGDLPPLPARPAPRAPLARGFRGGTDAAIARSLARSLSFSPSRAHTRACALSHPLSPSLFLSLSLSLFAHTCLCVLARGQSRRPRGRITDGMPTLSRRGTRPSTPGYPWTTSAITRTWHTSLARITTPRR